MADSNDGAHSLRWSDGTILGYTLPVPGLAARVYAEFDYASGDGKPGARVGPFNQLQPSTHSFLGVGFHSSRHADRRKRLLTDLARPSRFHLQRIGPLERARDDGDPRGGRDAPGSMLDELRGKTQCAVESPPFFTSADEALQLSPSELLQVTRAHRCRGIGPSDPRTPASGRALRIAESSRMRCRDLEHAPGHVSHDADPVSVGIRSKVTIPSVAMSSGITMNVYGEAQARRSTLSPTVRRRLECGEMHSLHWEML
jgi:hypothetical protein